MIIASCGTRPKPRSAYRCTLRKIQLVWVWPSSLMGTNDTLSVPCPTLRKHYYRWANTSWPSATQWQPRDSMHLAPRQTRRFTVQHCVARFCGSRSLRCTLSARCVPAARDGLVQPSTWTGIMWPAPPSCVAAMARCDVNWGLRVRFCALGTLAWSKAHGMHHWHVGSA